MILNLRGVERDGSIVMEMPNIILDRKLKFQIGVHRVHITIDTAGKENNAQENTVQHNNELLLISSNLVDRSAANPTQSIVYFNFKSKTNNIQSYYSPHIIFHNLHLHELSNASFQLCRFTGESLTLPVKEIFIQLELLRDISYGRI